MMTAVREGSRARRCRAGPGEGSSITWKGNGAMKKAMTGLVGLALMVSGCSSTGDNKMTQRQIDSKVRQLVAKMTPEEKVGQMTQITLEQFAKSGQDGY